MALRVYGGSGEGLGLGLRFIRLSLGVCHGCMRAHVFPYTILGLIWGVRIFRVGVRLRGLGGLGCKVDCRPLFKGLDVRTIIILILLVTSSFLVV